MQKILLILPCAASHTILRGTPNPKEQLRAEGAQRAAAQNHSTGYVHVLWDLTHSVWCGLLSNHGFALAVH